MAAATSIQSWRERRDVDLTNDAVDLTRFWREHEAAIGIRSNFGSMLAALEGMSTGSGPPAGWDPLVDRVQEIGRCRRTWQILREMDSRRQTTEIVTLYRLYGDVLYPSEYRHAFGDVASIASLTEAAASARDSHALDVGAAREVAVSEPLEKAVAAGRAKIERDVESAIASANRIVEKIDSLGRRIAQGQAKAAACPDEPVDPKRAAKLAALPPRRADLTRRLAAWDAHIATLQRAVGCDGLIQARLGVLVGADREVTVDDAIRHVLHTTRSDVAARSAFVVRVVQDGRALKQRAHDAYRSAKREHGWVGPSAPTQGVTAVDDEPGRDFAEARVRGSGWSST